ncbi:hypothetical protein R1flu_003200 [Riccia fluitans]|uniref:Uncharacterized protein n=1 Tax=Riccia fluitans TaxID=41844 RepID=A0ABD1Y8C4_9MARC
MKGDRPPGEVCFSGFGSKNYRTGAAKHNWQSSPVQGIAYSARTDPPDHPQSGDSRKDKSGLTVQDDLDNLVAEESSYGDTMIIDLITTVEVNKSFRRILREARIPLADREQGRGHLYSTILPQNKQHKQNVEMVEAQSEVGGGCQAGTKVDTQGKV